MTIDETKTRETWIPEGWERWPPTAVMAYTVKIDGKAGKIIRVPEGYLPIQGINQEEYG